MAKCFNGNILPTTMKTENFRELVRIRNKKIFVIHPQYFGRSNKKVSRRVEKEFYCSIFQCNFAFHDLESNKKDSKILDVILNGSNK